jgi:hypothetical protein
VPWWGVYAGLLISDRGTRLCLVLQTLEHRPHPTERVTPLSAVPARRSAIPPHQPAPHLP